MISTTTMIFHKPCAFHNKGVYQFLYVITHGFNALRYNLIQRWSFILKVIGKKTYFVVVKDYGRACFSNINNLCYNKYQILTCSQLLEGFQCESKLKTMKD
jgi:hypothetical protein